MESEVDALVQLEERIRRAVELIATLRSERDAALEELATARKSSGDGVKLKAEMETLRSERKEVRVRIEKLLGQLDQLSGS
jgi:FtsZ-binding cell division protein ZapB